jgi:class 3 adenylate cyclase
VTSEAKSYRHHKLVVALLVIACVLAPIAGTAVWINNQVTKTDRYVRTVKPLASNPDVQAAIATNVTNTLFARVDVVARTKAALPPRAEFLAPAVANSLHNVVQNATLRFVASDAFQRLWVRLNTRAHKELVKVLTGNGGKLVQTKNGQVVVDLAPVLARVEQRLHDRGINLFDRVQPNTIKSSFIILDSKNLEKVQRGVRLLKALAIALPLLVLALIATAIGLSERRRRTLLQASIGIAASKAVLGALLTIGRSIYLDQIVGPNLSTAAASAFYDTLVHYLRLGLRIVAAVALLVAAGAYLSGPYKSAVAIRGWFGFGTSRAPRDTGVAATSFGHWVTDHKKALRISAMVVPAAIFLLWNSPSLTVLIVLTAIALLLLLTIELIGRAPPAEYGTPTSVT